MRESNPEHGGNKCGALSTTSKVITFVDDHVYFKKYKGTMVMVMVPMYQWYLLWLKEE